MIRETKQRIVRTIETEVHDREDSLPFSRNQRNKAQKEREQIPGTERLKTGETKGLSVVSPKDPAAYLSRREEKEWNRLSPHAKRSFKQEKLAGSTGRKKGKCYGRIFPKEWISRGKRGYKSSLVSGESAFQPQKSGNGRRRRKPGIPGKRTEKTEETAGERQLEKNREAWNPDNNSRKLWE